MAAAFTVRDDFPKTILEFENRFGTEKDCIEFLANLRWPKGFICPECNHPVGWEARTGLVECASCHCQTSAIAGTAFHGTRKPLRLWFRAMYFMTTQKLGLSAKSFMRMMGFTSVDAPPAEACPT